MKKIIAFLMAVVFIMSSIAVIGVSADEPYYYVEYYGTGLNVDAPWIVPNDGPNGIQIFFTSGAISGPCAFYKIKDAFYSYMNCFSVESDIVYTADYQAMGGDIVNPYSLRVCDSYVLTYVDYPIPVTPLSPYMYTASNPNHNGRTHYVTYSATRTVLSVTTYHMVNNEDVMGTYYRSLFSSFYRTTVYYFT